MRKKNIYLSKLVSEKSLLLDLYEITPTVDMPIPDAKELVKSIFTYSLCMLSTFAMR